MLDHPGAGRPGSLARLPGPYQAGLLPWPGCLLVLHTLQLQQARTVFMGEQPLHLAPSGEQHRVEGRDRGQRQAHALEQPQGAILLDDLGRQPPLGRTGKRTPVPSGGEEPGADLCGGSKGALGGGRIL